MAVSTPRTPGRIFISYRRDEAAFSAGWLYDRLAAHFGRDQVFKDVDSIELGDDFAEVIADAVGACDVLLVLIGAHWLAISDEAGRRRLEDSDDFVRLEIEAALQRKVRIIPILVGSAKMPRADQLPVTLGKLVHRQALALDPNRFEADTGRLIRAVEKTLAEEEARREAEARRAAEESRLASVQTIAASLRTDGLAEVDADEAVLRRLAGHESQRVARAAQDALDAWEVEQHRRQSEAEQQAVPPKEAPDSFDESPSAASLATPAPAEAKATRESPTPPTDRTTEMADTPAPPQDTTSNDPAPPKLGSLPEQQAATTAPHTRDESRHATANKKRMPSRKVTVLVIVGAVLASLGLTALVLKYNNGSSAISSRESDPTPLTVREVFPSPHIVTGEGVQYDVLKSDLTSKCGPVGDAGIASALGDGECSQVVRGAVKSSDGTFIETLGIANLRDKEKASEAFNGVAGNHFYPLLLSYGTNILNSTGGAQWWDTDGHYLVYCLIYRVDGTSIAKNDRAAMEQMHNLLNGYLKDKVISARDK